METVIKREQDKRRRFFGCGNGDSGLCGPDARWAVRGSFLSNSHGQHEPSFVVALGGRVLVPLDKRKHLRGDMGTCRLLRGGDTSDTLYRGVSLYRNVSLYLDLRL